MSEGHRLFYGIELPANAHEVISKAVNGMKTACRFVDAHPKWSQLPNLHITLAFLGYVDVQQIETARDVMDDAVAGVGEFELELDGLSFFPPNARDPKVLVANIGGNGKGLKRLHQGLIREISAHGIFVDDRPFRPHLTLARITSTRTASRLAPVVKSHSAQVAVKFKVRELVLFESRLTEQGVAYSKVKSVDLKPGGVTGEVV